ncbi:MAG: divalent-cation tolerance protein CutA [Gemmatimonadetes bacterium]|nr:divalent-cation tolerance protein CutA [Gemmatimonadota bacterium]
MSGPDDASYLVVFTTLGTVEEARTFVHELVRRKLVACGTILPAATSIYRWEGAVTEALEAVVLLKTRQERWEDLLEATRTLHPYKVPEVLGVPVARGLDRYLQWIATETSVEDETKLP